MPGFDHVRNTALARFFFPNEKTLDPWSHITEDERKMNAQDIAAIRERFPTMVEKRFYVFVRNNPSASFMEKVDYWLCQRIPSLNKLGGSVVLELYKS